MDTDLMNVTDSGSTHFLTIEEIENVVQEGNQPAETLTNVVALIARRFNTDVCSAYLLEPDRANLVLAATLGLRRESVGSVRMALNEGLAGFTAEQMMPVSVEDVKKHPRFKYFREAGEDAYQSFLGVPLIDRGVLQGVLVVQTIERRSFREDEVRMLVEAAGQLAPIISEARTLDRFIAPTQEKLWSLARNLWWSWDQESTTLFRDLDSARWRALNHNPISLLSEIPFKELERRAMQMVLHGRINYAYRRQQEYLKADRTWGDTHAGVLRPRPVAYFPGIRIARVTANLFGWARRSGRRSREERLRFGDSPGWRWAFLRPGLLPADAGRQWLAARRVFGYRHQPTATGNSNWQRRVAGYGGGVYQNGLHPGESMADESGSH